MRQSAAPPSSSAPFLGFGSEAALRGFADALPEAIFTTDPEGRVTFWNAAAARVTGWRAEEALGRDCSLLAGDAFQGCFCGAGPLKCGLVEQGRTAKSCTVRAKDGRLLEVVKNAVPIYSADGRPVGALETFTAVGEIAAAGGEAPGAAAPVEGPAGLVGRHPSMEELFRTIGLVARSTAPVMILGESGTGKDRVAEAIHAASPRAAAPFVRVSCAALDERMLESELFGHVRGAFAGAREDRRGRIAEAQGGTLLLDEIADLPASLQPKLLRVIELRELERMGEPVPVRVDVRLLCSTHRNLKAMVAEGRFRADLYFRLAVFPLRIPPLRERGDDLPRIADAILARLARAEGARPAVLSPQALAALRAYPWPGNVRELESALAYAVLQAGGGAVEVAHLSEEIRNPGAAPAPAAQPGAGGDDGGPRRPRKGALPDRAEILAMVERCRGNRAEAARRLGISRVTLWKRLKAAAPEGGDGSSA
jgi:PAS domain S-box-containing protein